MQEIPSQSGFNIKLSPLPAMEIERTESKSPNFQDLLLQEKLLATSSIFMLLSLQGLLMHDYPSCAFHTTAAVAFFGFDKAVKPTESTKVFIILISLALYPPLLLALSPTQFTFCSIISCLIPVVNISLKLQSFCQFMYLLTTIIAWALSLLFESMLFSGSSENKRRHPWIQFLSLYLFSISYSFYTLNLEETEAKNEDSPKVESRPILSSLPTKMELPDIKSCTELPQELNELIKQKETFILRFSHEIRNPLNSLLGNIDLAKESIKDESVREMIEDAKVSGEILLQLLNNILDSSKIDSGKLEISYISCNIREFLEKMWLVTHDIIRKKKLYGSVYVGNSIPTYVKIDPHRIMQIILNMTTNAAKFTDRGSVKWYVDFLSVDTLGEKEMEPWYFSAHSSDYEGNYDTEEIPCDIDEKALCDYDILDISKKKFKKYNGATMQGDGEMNGYLRFEIVDTGCGMTQSSLRNLFKKFEQVSEESSKRQIGTGLGLWITKEIAEMMNGKIEVYSKKNFGSCFVIALKTEAVVKNSSIMKLPTLNNLPSLNCKKALVVDENAYNQDLIKRYLRKSNIEDIIALQNGLEAVDIFQKRGNGHFNFITITLNLVAFDGKKTIKLIRDHEKKENWKPIKIIVISPCLNEKEKKEFLNPNGLLRADLYLEMPISLEIIQKSISELEKKDIQNLAVLVAEDDFFNLNLLGNFMEKIGVQCLKAKNGEEAISLYTQQSDKIALILMDCEMPVVDGFTAAREISKRLKLAKRKVFIYGLTGHTEEQYRARCKEAGMQDMLTKPIDFPSLKQLVIRELLKMSTN